MVVAFKYDKLLDKRNIYEHNSFQLSWNYTDQNYLECEYLVHKNKFGYKKH